MFHALILAGGAGKRLWPLSREHKPKQMQKLFGGKTLLQLTYARVRKIFSRERVWLSVGKAHVKDVLRDLPNFPRENLIVEPVRRDKAPAIGLAAVLLRARDPHASFITVFSDHWIPDTAEYAKTVRFAGAVVGAHPHESVLIGMKPQYPETGYGYIEFAKRIDNLRFKIFPPKADPPRAEDFRLPVHRVKRFVEKPDVATATKYVASGNYLWNAGMFAWNAEHLLNLFKKYLPSHHRILMQIHRAARTVLRAHGGLSSVHRTIVRLYPKMRACDIEYAILEKTRRAMVIPAEFSWSDVGHWRTVHDILRNGGDRSVVRGRVLEFGGRNNLIVGAGKRVVACAGLENILVIDTDDALLVCNRNHAQEVKRIVDALAKKKLSHYV